MKGDSFFLCAFTLEGQKSRCIIDKLHGFCLFVLILNVPVNTFSVMLVGSIWPMG